MSRYEEVNEEESFYITMTDIMVGLLFIFLLLIMYFAVQSKVDQAETERTNELLRYQAAVAEQRNNLLQWIGAHLTESGVVGVEIIQDQGVIRLPEGILFGTGEWQFRVGSAAARTAHSLARAFDEVLPCSVLQSDGTPFLPSDECEQTAFHNRNNGFIQAIYVEGHTDNVPVRGALRGDPNLTNNLRLSARRATTTYEAIIEVAPRILEFNGPVLGERDLRFDPILASSAYGEWRPVASNETTTGQAANRRIDIRVVMYVPPNLEAMKEFHETIGSVLSR